MAPLKVGIYVRTTILSPKYDTYERELLSFCEQRNWNNVVIYRDQVGGRIAQSGFDALEGSLKKGTVDNELIGQLLRQQEEGGRRNRDGFGKLLGDASRGQLDMILVHDVGQLGCTKIEIFNALESLSRTGTKVTILGLGEVGGDTPLFGVSPIDCPDAYGSSPSGSGGF